MDQAALYSKLNTSSIHKYCKESNKFINGYAHKKLSPKEYRDCLNMKERSDAKQNINAG